MSKKLKLIVFSCLLLTAAVLLISCGAVTSPFESYDQSGYTVSVDYDANGATFTTGVEVMRDTYDLSTFNTLANGNKEIMLIDPADENRGQNKYFKLTYTGYVFAGWYRSITENKDADGNVISYTYSDPWDFSKPLEIDPNADYTSEDPVITLYAGWIPKSDFGFKYEFYKVENGVADSEPFHTIEIEDPSKIPSLTLPAENSTTGEVRAYNDFPVVKDLTYDQISFNADMSEPITASEITHGGSIDTATATPMNPVTKIYCTFTDGYYCDITTEEQLMAAPKDAILRLKNDLDFTGKTWSAVVATGTFSGSIEGNGHKISNVTLNNKGAKGVNYALFGEITSTASLKDVTFENITVQISDGEVANSSTAKINYAIIAGTVGDDAEFTNVKLENSKLVISTDRTFSNQTSKMSFGLVCASGTAVGVDFSAGVNVEYDAFGSTLTRSYTEDIDGDGKITLTVVK